MRASYLTNIALVLIVVTLFWYNNTTFEPHIPATTLSNLHVDDINQIIIQRDNRDPIELHKSVSGWNITHPIQTQANKTRVKLLLSVLTLPVHSQFKPEYSQSLSQFGLEHSKVSLQLNNLLFNFGDTESISKRRYVKHNDTIYLIDDNISPLLNATIASFINNRLIYPSDKISKLTLPQLVNGDITLNSLPLTIININGTWQTTSSSQSLSADQLTALIDAWQHAQALQVFPLSEMMLSELPPSNASLWLKSQTKPLELFISSNANSIFIINKKAKLKYQFPATIKQQLFVNSAVSD